MKSFIKYLIILLFNISVIIISPIVTTLFFMCSGINCNFYPGTLIIFSMAVIGMITFKFIMTVIFNEEIYWSSIIIGPVLAVAYNLVMILIVTFA